MNAVTEVAVAVQKLNRLVAGTRTEGESPFALIGGMYLGIKQVPVRGKDGTLVVDKEGRPVTESHIQLKAHSPINRALLLPLGTHFPARRLHTLGKNDRPNIRELKKFILCGMFGESWARHATVESTIGGLTDVGEEMPVASSNKGSVDSDQPVRKKSRGRQREVKKLKRDQDDKAATSTLH